MKYQSKARVFSFLVILSMLISALGIPTQNALAAAGTALQFDGTTANKQHVTFGAAPGLGVTTFTLESWIKRAAGGATMTTGSLGFDGAGGRPNGLYPVVTKGMGEGETPANINMNYIMGITVTGVIGADFEDKTNGTNHPIWGTTVVPVGEWHHIAITYTGTCWAIYLDGNAETMNGTTCPNATPESISVQHAGLAAGLNSTGGLATGFFSGSIDEARVWNRALSQSEIQTNKDSEVTSGSGLLARWGLNEGSGTAIGSSVGSFPGTVKSSTATLPAWVTGFPTVVTTPPNAPSGLAVTAPSGYQTHLTWNDNADNEANFELERSVTGAGGAYGLLSNVASDVEAYDDNDVQPSHEYCYRIRAVNSVGQSTYDGPQCLTTPAESNSALDFGGTNAYVNFANPAELHLAQFTLETWFRRDGTGDPTTTGTGGIANATALVARGRGEAEDPAVDLNYFLGIDTVTNVLIADFEEGASGPSPSLNHPVLGTTTITNGVWHHAAATYDGTTWRLYLDGVLDGQAIVNQPPAAAGNQYASIGAALTSTGLADGFFNGLIDEARIWNHALSVSELQANINQPLTSGTGLVARWGLNEGSGTSIRDAVNPFSNGTLTGANVVWDPSGAPFNLTFNQAPLAPTLVQPANGASNISVAPALEVTVSDPDSNPMDVTFYGRQADGTGEDFSIVVLPDTQLYSESTPSTFTAQTQWIVNNAAALNIKYVSHLGDLVNVANTESQWINADAAMDLLDAANVPYGVVPGNHDEGSLNFYNTYFGVSRFDEKPYYAGEFPTGDNSSSYALFSAGGMDFIFLNLDYTNPDAGLLTWADNLLKTHSNRRAIVTSHNILNTAGNPSSYASWGQSIYNELKDNPNLFLTLSGHVSGEGRRTDVYNGSTVYSLMSDYQDRPNGGNGWLRILQFSPANDVVHVKTYSPTLNSYETDADSQFDLTYEMGGSSFTALGTKTDVASGSSTSVAWPGRSLGAQYEWYVDVSDGLQTVHGPTWGFTTVPPISRTLTLAVNPIAGGTTNPAAGSHTYNDGAFVSVTPTANSGYHFVNWSGACSGAGACQVTMDGDKTVTANFALNTYLLSVSKTGTGSGTVTSIPDGINCGSDCSQDYSQSTSVTLTASASTGSTFTGWTGACTGTGTCQVTMDAAKSVAANFTLGTNVLSVTKTGNGSGTIASVPAGISCGSDCSENYSFGTSVTLTASPATGSTFTGWSGACSGTGTCQVTMNATQTVTAAFAKQAVTLTVNTTGSGTVVRDDMGPYEYGDSVQLTATPAAGWHFLSWSVDLTGSTNPSAVVLNGNKTVTATFEQDVSVLTCESFNSFTPGAMIGTYTGWYDGSSGPVVTSGNGVASSIGLAPAANIYNWTAHPFNWNASDFRSIVLQQDFKSDASGAFDDDRLGWTTVSNSIDSANQFGVQLDTPDGGITTYWRNGTTRIQDPIVALSGIKANTWYRFNAEITKLTATSARINVSLVELNASGSPTGTPITGSIADTSLLASGKTPSAVYFTPTSMWPSYKTYNAAASAPADNACYEVVNGTPLPQYNLTANVSGSGTVTLNPSGGTYYQGTIVQLTAVPAVGYTFSGWSGALTGSTNPAALTMNGNKTVTATFTQAPPVALTVTTVGSGSVTLNPSGGTYPVGTTVQLTPVPAAGYTFSGWSGALTGSTNPASIVMDAAKAVTATFSELPPQPAGVCESFNSGFTAGQVVGTHAQWFDSGAGPVVTSTNGVANSVGLAPGSSVFTWTQHPFNWNNPDFESITFNMDYQTNANGQFDDDRLGWMIRDADANSGYFFGVQLDTVTGGDGGIVTYWRKNIDDTSDASRVQTPIVTMGSLTANTWYRLEATVTKLTATSAKIDVSLVQLNASGSPTGTPITGTLTDTSTWAGGAPDVRLFNATNMWPAYKNHDAIQGAADNACFDITSGRFAFVVTSDWHTSDANGAANATTKLGQVASWVNNPTSSMPAPEFMVVTGDFPAAPQTESVIDSVLGTNFLWFPVIGNHEIDDGIANFNYVRDTLVPALPGTVVVNHGPTGSVNTTYSWNYENSHFVAINGYWNGTTNTGADSAADGDISVAMRTWLGADLSANGKSHNFAFIHEPAYPDTRHQGDSLDKYPANRDAFVASLNAGNVETLFTGHTHYYEHDVAPEYPLGALDQITSGALRAGETSTITYVLVEGATTTYKVYSWNGSAFTLLEQWSIGGAEPTVPPTAPTSMDAVAETYARVGLTWSDNADNESGFEIERSTTGSGGPFTLLATVPANTEAYTDNGLTAQKEYCYRVRAVNTAGPSSYSNVDCVTTPEQPPFVGVCESFDSGFTAGQMIGIHADWYDGNSGPVVTTGNGVASSIGLAAATNIFTWTAQPFTWNDPAFQGVNLTMDFKSDGSGAFDDDRLSWSISDNSIDSVNQFGVQLDTPDGGITTYWRNGTTRVQDPIVPLTGIKANTWYRFNAEITKLTGTSARIDVSLVELNASGNPTGTPITGSIADTSLLASGKTPDASYFTATTMWPSYKTYNSGASAPADNACFEALSGLNTNISSRPSNPSTSADASFSFTSSKTGSSFECNLDNGTFESCASPKNYTGLTDGSHTFAVRAINGTEVDATPATYTWMINTAAPSNLVGYWRLDEGLGTKAGDSSGYGNDGTVSGATWTNGKFNGALNFDGVDDRVQIPASSSLSLDTNQVTFATWLYADTLAAPWSTIMQRSNATWFDWQLYAKDDWRSGHPSCRIDWNKNGSIDADEDVEGNTVLQTGTWYHMACTYDGTALKLYINGVLQDTNPKVGGVIPNSGGGIWLGANETWGAYYDGRLDDTYIYNRALSQTEIQSLMEGTTCYALTLSHTGQGSNPVASPANSAGCSAGQYTAGANINLSGAVPASDWQISGWTGTNNNSSTAAINAITMPTSAHTAGVNYSQIEYTLTVNVAGSGSVTKNPNQATYHYGDVVQLTAVPATGWTFANWTGDATGTNNPVSVTINGNKTVTANYVQNQNGYTLTITSAHGTVTKSPDKATYGYGEVVQLKATADHDWLFANWSGDVTGTTNPISITMNGSQSITANFLRRGADTTGVFRPTNGALYLKNKNETGFADVQINYGLGGDYPIVGDWDGDGDATIGIYRNGSFYLRNENTIGYADIVFPFGAPGDQPVAGDWNGDGIDTIGVYRNGTFFLRNSNQAGAPEMTFALGVPGDVGIAGDWDGDGKDTTGVFRPSNGALYLKNKNETGFADVQINYGLAGDKPVTGDWDNDGVDTIGVYRNGQFMLRNSNTIGFADWVFALGVPGDMPIAGNWDGLP